MSKKHQFIIHPLISAVYPILFLYSTNLENLFLSRIISPIFWSIIVTLVMYLIFLKIFNNSLKAAFAVTLIDAFFFSFGHFFPPERSLTVAKIALVGFSLILLSVLYLIYKTKKELGNLNQLLNAASLFLIILVAVQITLGLSRFAKNNQLFPSLNLTASEKSPKPDIYYIILDAYARSDVLDRIYGKDNQKFLDFLKGNGFYLADHSSSNYIQTALSLSTSLNLQYPDTPQNLTSNNRQGLSQAIKNSQLANFLDEAGYQTISFATGYSLTDMETTDQFLKPKIYLDEFSTMLYNTTPLGIISGNDSSSIKNQTYSRYEERIRFILEKLQNLPNDQSPRFVFTHLTVPHPPFVFRADGGLQKINRPFDMGDASHFTGGDANRIQEYLDGYKQQIDFVNNQMTKVIKKILEDKNPKIVIIQADHGPGSHLTWESLEKTDIQERTAILNAYYFSDQNYQQLYPTISPVNSFRIVLNQYFGTNLPLLPDRSFFSSWNKPFNFVEVTDRIK